MPRTSRLHLAFIIILFFVVSAPGQKSDSKQQRLTDSKSNHVVKTAINSSLPFKLINNYMIVLPVMINGHGPFNFLFDSATTTTIIDPQLAKLLELQTSSSNTPLITLAGNRSLPWTKLDSFNLGNIQLNDLPSIIADITEIQNASPNIKGVIGANASTQFNYFIEYDKNTFHTEQIDEIAGQLSGTLIQTMRDAGRSLITVTDPHTQRKSLLVLDSAIPEIILFNKSKDTLDFKPLSASNPTKELGTTNGNTSARPVILKELTISNDLTITKNPAYLVQDPVNDTRPEHGLLPTRLFRSIYVNNRESIIMLNPRY
jgi:hypothetical protein